MSEVTAAALISAVASIIIQLIISSGKERENNARMAAHEQKQEDALSEVKKEMTEVKRKLDIHNGYAEKISDIRGDIKAINAKLK